MNVLVVGGTRFVGPLLVFRLLARGDRVTLFNRGTHDDAFGDRVERLRGDRTTADLVRAMEDRTFDAVVDFVAYEGRDVERAIEAFSGRIGHYVLISTGQVYLVRDPVTPPSRETDYDGPTIPRPEGEDGAEWDYGMGKRACEDLLVAHPELRSTRLRIPMVNGPRDHHRRIERLVHRMLDGGPLLLPEADRRVRHVDAAEVARTVATLLGDARAFGQAFNQAQDETPTLGEFIAAIAAEIGATTRIVPVEPEALRDAGLSPRTVSPFGGPWMSFLDPAKIRALGVDHAPLDRTVAKVVAELLAHLPAPPEDYVTNRARELAFVARL